MRSRDLRPAPVWITPELVGRILALAMPLDGKPVPVKQVPTRGVKPKLAIVTEIDVVPPSGAKIRSGQDGPREKSGAVTRQSSGAVRTAPAKPTSPTPNPPAEHARRPEEDEAAAVAPHAASPPRRGNPHPTNAAELAAGRVKHNDLRKARAEAHLDTNRPLYQIAFDRGIAVSDLARALGEKAGTVLVHTKRAGFDFGRRPLLADGLALEQLRALADPATPLPELRADRLKRERLARWAGIRRDGRAADVERRRSERAAAAQRRAHEAEQARAEGRRRRELQRSERAAARAVKAAPKPRPIREAKPAAICRPARPAPSREPALPAPPEARAHPVSERPLGRPTGILAYAERMRAAVEHLRARHFTVQRHSRDEIIARWHVSGWNGLFSNEQLVELAIGYGLELRA